MPLQNAPLYLNSFRSLNIGNSPVINDNAGLNFRNCAPSQFMELRSIINSQQSSAGAMNLSSLPISGMLQRSNRQFLSSSGFHNYYQEGNVPRPNENHLSLQHHSTLTHTMLHGANNSILNTGSEFPSEGAPNSSNTRQANIK